MIEMVFGNINTDEEVRDDNLDTDDTLQVSSVAMPKVKVAHLSGAQRESYLKAYDCVVTHDFKDEYHLTEEERMKRNQYYELFKPIRKMRHTIRKLDEYVIAIRQILHCIDVISETNGLYDPEEFKSMVLNGKVNIFGLTFPKYKGKDRKELSSKYLADFILSDTDPKELMLTSDDIATFDKEKLKNAVFKPNELDSIVDTIAHDREEYLNDDEGWAVEVLPKKKNTAFTRDTPSMILAVKDLKRKSKQKSGMERLVSDMSFDDIEQIQRYDMKHGYISDESDIPKYKGGSVDKYIAQLDKYERTQIKFNYHGKMLSLDEIDEIELKEMLNESGWNILAFANNRRETKKLNKIRRADEKRAKKLKARLDATTRRIERTTEALGKSDKKKKKKKKKKGGDD